MAALDRYVELFDSVLVIGDGPHSSPKANARLFLKKNLRGTKLELADYEKTWQNFTNSLLFVCDEYNMHVVLELLKLSDSLRFKDHQIVATTFEALEEWKMLVVHAFLRDRMIPSMIEPIHCLNWCRLLGCDSDIHRIMVKENLWRDLAAAMVRVLPAMDHNCRLRVLFQSSACCPWKKAVLATSFVPAVFRAIYGNAEKGTSKRKKFQRLLGFYEPGNLFDFALSPRTPISLVGFAFRNMQEILDINDSEAPLVGDPRIVDVLERLASHPETIAHATYLLQMPVIRDDADEINSACRRRPLIEHWVDHGLIALCRDYKVSGYQRDALLERLRKIPAAFACSRAVMLKGKSTATEEGVDSEQQFLEDDAFSLSELMFPLAARAARRFHTNPSYLFVLTEGVDAL